MLDPRLFSIYHGMSYFAPHQAWQLDGHALKLLLLRVAYHSHTVLDNEKVGIREQQE